VNGEEGADGNVNERNVEASAVARNEYAEKVDESAADVNVDANAAAENADKGISESSMPDLKADASTPNVKVDVNTPNTTNGGVDGHSLVNGGNPSSASPDSDILGEIAGIRHIPYRKEQRTYPGLPSSNALKDVRNRKYLAECILRIVETEEPIKEGLLYRRVASAFGFARAGDNIRQIVKDLLLFLKIPYTKLSPSGELVYWKSADNIERYDSFRTRGDRIIIDVPYDELINAALYVLASDIAIPKDDLVKAVSNLYEFQRIGPKLSEYIEEAIDVAVKKGMILDQDGTMVYRG